MYDWLCYLATFSNIIFYKCGQVTKPIIVVKMPSCKLLYITLIQIKGSSWPYLISKVWVTYNHSNNAASDWPRTFLQPGCFCLGCDYDACECPNYAH